MNVVRGRAKLILDKEVEGDDITNSARIVVEQSERMTQLIRELLDFARPRAPKKSPVDVTRGSARVCELVATIARKGQITLVPPTANEAHRTEADDGQITQVLTNLVVNAIQATPANGNVTIRTRAVEQTPPPYVGGDVRSWLAIAVEDTGAGMDEATRIRVFEPFYTTKDIGDGTGLGLSVSWGIIREHGGWIDIVSTPGEGSTFTVYIPKGNL